MTHLLTEYWSKPQPPVFIWPIQCAVRSNNGQHCDEVPIVKTDTGHWLCARCYRLYVAGAFKPYGRSAQPLNPKPPMSEPKDWIDEEGDRRSAGIHHALTQDQHAEVNERYEGCTLEYCSACGSATGRAGAGDGSIFVGDAGPFCEECYHAMPSRAAQRDALLSALKAVEWNYDGRDNDYRCTCCFRLKTQGHLAGCPTFKAIRDAEAQG